MNFINDTTRKTSRSNYKNGREIIQGDRTIMNFEDILIWNIIHLDTLLDIIEEYNQKEIEN